MIEINKIAELIAAACEEEKARDIMILEVNDLTIIADYFVIASGRSVVQVRSVIEHVQDKLKEIGLLPSRIDGHTQGTWVVLDYDSVILHVFRQEEREYYQLETLWGDAPPAYLNR